MKNKIILSLSLIFVFITGSSLSAAEIIFKEKVNASGEWVKIEDIAVIKGTKKEKAAIKEIYFGKCPEKGSPKILSEAYINRRLRQFEFYGSPHHVSIPKNGVTVIRGDKSNRVEEVADVCENVLRSHFKDFSRVDVFLEDPDQHLVKAPKGLIHVGIPSIKHLPYFSSEQTLYLDIRINNRKIKGYFKVEIKMYKNQVVLNKAVPVKRKILERYLELRDCLVEKDHIKGFTKIEDVVGQSLKKYQRPNHRLIPEDFQPQQLITKGERIYVDNGSKSVRVTFYAIALNSGYKDKIITCKTPSNRLLKVKVTGKGKAILYKKKSNVIVIDSKAVITTSKEKSK